MPRDAAPDGSSNDRWAVVLGASSGTGAAIARAVARDPGLHVFGAHRGRHPEEAEALQAEVALAGRRFASFVGDAGTVEGVAAGAEALLAAAGPRSVGFFVHSIANASVGRFASGAADQLKPRQFHKTFDSMAHSFVWWIEEMLARDLLAPGARLLALTNPLHESLLRQCGLVLASKAALEVYVRHLAFELGPRGYRVNMLKFPTVMTTAVEKVYSPEALARLEASHRRMIPAGRMCTVDEVGRFVSLLLDQRAEWLNGATIDYSGGMTQSLLDLVLVEGAGGA
jgi:NAD(P)-dependent dehydrogenase (short-subunit alcohol dehydrogenase family)